MEWLLMHSEDADADAPLTAEQKRQLVAIYGPCTCPQSSLMSLCTKRTPWSLTRSLFLLLRSTSR
jgi:hypothetical protein